MRIGFLTACLPNVPLEQLVPWAAEAGFTAMEVAAWPIKNTRDYAGSSIDVANLTPQKAEEIKQLFSKHNILISSLAYYDNNLDPDPEGRAFKHNHLKKVIDAAAMIGVGIVGTFIGRDPSKTIQGNLEEMARVFRPLLDYAKSKGIKLMIENCPMEGWQFEGLIGNLAYSPEMWTKMFETLPDEHFGLNLDPSHLYWLGVDYIEAAKKFAPRIFHVHAKDTEILKHNLSTTSILGHRWWRYRMPGLGEIQWQKFISMLGEVGYDYVLSTEHEDPVWEGSEEKVKKGLVLGKRFLAQFVI